MVSGPHREGKGCRRHLRGHNSCSTWAAQGAVQSIYATRARGVHTVLSTQPCSAGISKRTRRSKVWTLVEFRSRAPPRGLSWAAVPIATLSLPSPAAGKEREVRGH